MVTYKATVDMIPTLKEEEKAQIMAWLVEAREFATFTKKGKCIDNPATGDLTSC